MVLKKKSAGFDIRKVKGRDEKIFAKWFNKSANSKTESTPKVYVPESRRLSTYFGIWLFIIILFAPLSDKYLGLISTDTLGKIWFLSLPVLLLICFYKQLEIGKINYTIIIILTFLFYSWSKNDVWTKLLG